MLKAKPFGITLCAVLLMALVTDASAAPKKYKISGKITNSSSADKVLLIQKNRVKSASISSSNGKFNFNNLTLANLKKARLYFFLDGAPVGPGVFKETSTYKYLKFSGKAPSNTQNLKVTFSPQTGYLKATKKVNGQWVDKSKVANSNFTGASLGYAGASGSATQALKIAAAEDEASLVLDSDSDGVPDILDIDDDNDGIPDDRDEGGGGVISSLYADYSNTINAHLGNLNSTSISALFSSSNVFALTLFMGTTSFSGATGGHVVCDASQVICRSSADGGSSSFYTGVSESDSSITNQRWSDYNADGSGRPNLEPIVFQGGSEVVLVGAIQPRSSSFRAGELITANVTNASGSILGSRVFSILPPPISSPMLYSFNTGSGLTIVDYDDASAPGSSIGNAINLTGGTITMNFYPPQREAIPGVESDGEYRDIGNSKIGVLVGGSGISTEFTCAGFYSGLSDGITEISQSESLPNGAFVPSSGAVLWPLVDSAPDVATSAGTLKSLTVDLASCISRAGVSAGTYIVTLTYAGADTQFGVTRAAQNIYMTIP
jgi:hypothetical protein